MIYIDKSSKEPYYLQIYNNILNDILNEKIKPGTVLKGSRKLSEQLGVSRNTVNSAYGQLAAEGYIDSKKGSSFKVLNIPKLNNKQEKTFQDNKSVSYKKEENNIIFDLNYSNSLFPFEKWKKYSLESINNYYNICMEKDKKGNAFLRQELSKYLYESRGVSCSYEQIIITSGLQDSLRIIGNLLELAKGTVVIEDPCYHSAYSVLEEYSNIEKLNIDKEGMKVPRNSKDIKATYVTPSHQFPTGIVMSIKRRYELLKWAQRNKAYIIEDDYDSEFTYYNKPIPSLQSIDKNERVIYLGTFSKSISSAIRMGYIIIPKNLMEIYEEKNRYYNSTVSLLDQYAVGRFIESGDYKKHIRRLSVSFKKNYREFIKGLQGLNKNMKIHDSGAGIWILLEFPKEISKDKLMKSAEEKGVKVYSSQDNWHEEERENIFILLGLAHIKHKDIGDCINRLKEAWMKYI